MSRGGYPIPCWGWVGGYPMFGGYPIPCPGGYPITCLGGTPSHVWRGVPRPMSGGGTPRPEMGYPSGQTWDGVPPQPDLGWGTPSQTWDGVPPLARPGMGYPPQPDLGWGTPPARPGMGYPLYHPDLDGEPPPPPRNVNRQTPVKTVTSRHTTYAGGNKLKSGKPWLLVLIKSKKPVFRFTFLQN